MHRLLLLLVVLNVCLRAEGAPYQEGVRAVWHKEYATVDACLKELAKDPSQDIYLKFLKAQLIERQQGSHEALVYLRRVVGAFTAIEDYPIEIRLVYYRILGDGEDPRQAQFLIDKIGGRGGPIPLLLAAETMSDLNVGLQRWEEALQWIDEALQFVHQNFYDQTGKQVPHYVSRFEEKRAYIVDTMEIMIHGLGFHLYRIANTQRLAGHYSDAATTYHHLEDLYVSNVGKPIIAIKGPDDPKIEELPIYDVYAEASRVYWAESLLEVGPLDEVQGILKPLLVGSNNPYRGEAYLVLGNYMLTVLKDAATASASYSKALTWADETRRLSSPFAHDAVPEVSKEITAPAEAMRHVGDWGNVSWFSFTANQVYNPCTCPWYCDYLTYNAQTHRALARYLNGNTSGAIKDLEVIPALDPIDQKVYKEGLPSNYSRLVSDFKSDRMYATKTELALFQGPIFFELAQAEFYFELEMWDKANIAYQHIHTTFGDRLTSSQRAYLTYAQCAIQVLSGQTGDATVRLTQLIADYPKAPSIPRALLLLSDLTENIDAKCALLDKATDSAEDHATAFAMQFRKAQTYYAYGRSVEAKELFSRLRSASKDQAEIRQCDGYLQSSTLNTPKVATP